MSDQTFAGLLKAMSEGADEWRHDITGWAFLSGGVFLMGWHARPDDREVSPEKERAVLREAARVVSEYLSRVAAA